MSVFEDFSDEYDSSDKYGEFDSSVISRYKGVVQDELLGFWEEEGLAGYAVGIFWTITH